MQSQPSEKLTVIGVVQPVNGNNATSSTAAIDVSKWEEVVALLQMGVIDATVDFNITASATSGGSFNNAGLTAKAITQFAATDDGKSAMINLKTDDLLAVNKPFIKANITVASGTSSLVSCVVLGIRPRFGPASDDKLATLAQIIT